MKKDPAIFLQHILESIQTIEEYTKGLSEDAFLEERRTQDAIVRRLEIGEAVRKLPEETKNLASDAAWRQIIAMRNILIHEYFGVDLKLVWRVVEKDLPAFKKHVETLLKTAE
jgi:uncharacterized protein with HEPN domain